MTTELLSPCREALRKLAVLRATPPVRDLVGSELDGIIRILSDGLRRERVLQVRSSETTDPKQVAREALCAATVSFRCANPQ